MNRIQTSIVAALALMVAIVAAPAIAADVTHSTPGISGYDPVAYFTDGKPVKGSGYHVAEYDGVNYAFSSKEHQKIFEANPGKYVPAYGGWCAYGVAVGKKFVSDPEAWMIVKGKLYLNLDKDIQNKWAKDIPGYIQTANTNWRDIKDKSPSTL